MRGFEPMTLANMRLNGIRNGHRVMRQLRPLGRRQCRSAVGDPDSLRGRQTALLQQLRRQDDINQPRLAYERTAGRS
jgi:hypothetical protein